MPCRLILGAYLFFSLWFFWLWLWSWSGVSNIPPEAYAHSPSKEVKINYFGIGLVQWVPANWDLDEGIFSVQC